MPEKKRKERSDRPTETQKLKLKDLEVDPAEGEQTKGGIASASVAWGTVN